MNMKKILSSGLALSLSLMMLAGCANDTTSPSESTQPSASTPVSSDVQPSESTTPAAEPSESTEPSESVDVPTPVEPTDLDYTSDVTALEGTWTLSQVYADGATTDATAGAMSFEVSLELDPSELVDEAAYIHNQVYNLTGRLTFGLDAINQTLAADDVEEYKGSTAWSDFPQGEVVTDGDFYKQPGPATMRFKDVDDYGLFLDQVAGVSADIDTTEKTLIIGLNGEGQLLLGFSEEHLERPGTEGEWVYCLIFDKAA
ncbi:hypothetical protein [uncultured Pseudoflavonifractor sp.]|uniref:hypothetical protein n=1 Tax=uncultured Pseudoflavonifractor sp. TaxID=1221379 RepID=UPI0025E4795A|nr:hypothetical protein [uncultured Pseudoflavonifractor sp.]